MEILHVNICMFSCFFHGSAVPQGKQTELSHVYVVPMTTIRRPQGCSALSVSAVPLVCRKHVPALSRIKFSRLWLQSCKLLYLLWKMSLTPAQTTGPVGPLPAAILQHLHCSQCITASYSLWGWQSTTEAPKSSRCLQIQGQKNPSSWMVAGGHLATGSPRPHASKVVPAPAESLLFSDALKAWQMPSSDSVLPSLNNSGYASWAPPGDLHLCVANFWIQKITFMSLSQKLLSAGDASHLFLFPLTQFKRYVHFSLEAPFCQTPTDPWHSNLVLVNLLWLWM